MSDSVSPPGLGTRLLHLFALGALVVAQPLLDLLSREATFFVVHRLERGDLLLLAALLLLAPLPLALVELLLARAPARVQHRVHGVFVTLLLALFVLLVLRRSSLDGWAALAVAAATGAALAVAYYRLAPLRTLTSVLALALVLVPATFFTRPQIQRLMATRQLTGLDLPAVGSRAPVVLVIFDELPLSALLDDHDRINPLRHPNLAALAARATWFRNTFAAAENTQRAVPAILTGRLPPSGAVPSLADHPRNVFTLFGGDYPIYASEPVTQLCPPGLNRLEAVDERSSRRARLTAVLGDLRLVWAHLVLPPRLTAGLPPIDATWSGFAGARASDDVPGDDAPSTEREFHSRALAAVRGDRPEQLERFLAAIDDAPGGPSLYVLHSSLPHFPWNLVPTGQQYPAPPGMPGLRAERWIEGLDAADVTRAYQRLLVQVGYVDAFVGRLTAKLEERGLFDRALIVVVADHGVAIHPGRHRRLVSPETIHDILSVPFLIKAPGQREGRVLDHPVSTLDVLPTMLELLEIEVPWTFDGRAALAPPADAAPLVFPSLESGQLTIDVDALVAGRRQTVAWKRARFGDGDDPFDVYRTGPHGELLGRAVADLRQGRPSTWRAVFNQPELLGDVDPDGPTLPLLLRGRVRRPPAAAAREGVLAFVRDGIVVATEPVPPAAEGLAGFEVFLPYFGWREGANPIAFWEVRQGAGGGLGLHALP